ncbi:MAG: hydroxylamine reductase [Syntrophorhabdaceae bacterium]|nr:hydroxylamine reductase [Syntrophorhabdaceae bacterium]
MFCFQCEETAKGTGCTVNGVCGKKADVANLQDKLTGELIELAKASEGNKPSESTHKAVIDGLFATVTNVSFSDEAILRQIGIVKEEKAKLMLYCADCASDCCSKSDFYDMALFWGGNEDIRSLKSLLLFGLRGMAAYAHHAYVLGKADETVNNFFYKGLIALGKDSSADELLSLIMEFGGENLKCMELLDEANTGAYGNPAPAKVSCNVEPGPFIVISGHDLHDLELLLKQTRGKGVNVYTHCEMLPAHGYPELKKYPHLKGNFGTAWQNQQKEFENIPAPVLFTTNCLMPVKPGYADRVFTTSVVSYPDIKHIGDDKDFTPVIKKALSLGGYKELRKMTGINGGDTLTTGFAKGTVLSVADKVIEAVKAGAIRHFFLVGGCDGAKPGRNYYTEFVKKSPKDTIILTLACGKYRFNDLDIGEIGGLPRIMDMGQCNDAYSAINVAVALSEAFNCSVNELPLTLVLSWYEQKAVCILLTLLSLGIKNIYIGPSLPAFISPNILNVLVEKFSLTPVSTPEADLKKILG